MTRFVVNLDQRLKLTAFVLIQRMHDDEQLLTLAKEAVDFNTISETLHKNKKYMPTGGDGALK